MKRKKIVVPAFFAIAIFLLSGCAGNPPQHTYWLQNPVTGTYSAHRTYSALSSDEVRELGLVKELPAGARVID